MKFLRSIKNIQRNNLYYMLFVILLAFNGLYVFAIKHLDKKAGLEGTLKFLLQNPLGWVVAILTGIFAWFIFVILLISNIIELPIISELTMDDDHVSYEEIPGKQMIFNIILCIIALILNCIFLGHLSVLLIILIGMCILLYSIM